MDVLNKDPHARTNSRGRFGFFDPTGITQRHSSKHPNKSVLEVLSVSKLDPNDEVLLSKMVHPKYIKGIVVSDEDEKRYMMKSLLKDGTVQEGKINGIY